MALQSVCNHCTSLTVVSAINSRLLCVNHALISPVRTHPVLRVALPLSVPSTHHSHHPSPLYSSIPFLQILPTAAFLFFFRTDSTDSLDCLPIGLLQYNNTMSVDGRRCILYARIYIPYVHTILYYYVQTGRPPVPISSELKLKTNS